MTLDANRLSRCRDRQSSVRAAKPVQRLRLSRRNHNSLESIYNQAAVSSPPPTFGITTPARASITIAIVGRVRTAQQMNAAHYTAVALIYA